jgi:hypothetical protein
VGPAGGERKKKERIGKDLKNYISSSAKNKVLYLGEGNEDEDAFAE